MQGGVRSGDCADDVEVLEQSYASRRLEVWGWPIQSFHSSDGYPGLAGLQHHHHSVDVWDGDTSVFAETPGEKSRHGEVKKNHRSGIDNERRRCETAKLPLLAVAWFLSVVQRLYLAMTWRYGFVTQHSNKEQDFEVLNASAQPLGKVCMTDILFVSSPILLNFFSRNTSG